MLNASFIIVLATVTLNMMGVGLVWPIIPSLVRELTAGNVSEVAWIYGATAIVFSVMQFIFSPILGALSDRYGRRPIMLTALLALGLDNIVLALAPTIGWLFVARALGGVFGATMSIANAYVADTFKKEDRAAGFGLIGAAFGIGFTLGPLLGGVLGAIDLRLPFYCAAGLSLANALFGLFFLRESLPVEKREKGTFALENPFGAITWLFSNPVLRLLGIASLIVAIIQRGLESIWVIFTEYQYGWNVQEAGFSLAVVGVSSIVTQGFLVRHVVRFLGETKTVIYGFILSATMYAILSFNTWGLIGYLGIIPHILGWGCASPALQAIASRQIGPDKQGRLQGAFSAIFGLSAIAGPALATSSFAIATTPGSGFHLPGAFFILGAFVLLTASWMGALAGRKEQKMSQ